MLYRSYFGWHGKKLHRMFMALALLIGNITLTFLVAFINNAFAALNGLLMQPGITYTAFFSSLIHVCGSLFLWGFVATLNDWMARTLGIHLSQDINEQLENRWISTKAYFGLSFLGYKDNPASVMSNDIPELNIQTISLLNSLLMSIGNFAVGMFGLYQTSGTLSFTLFSIPFNLPGYMALCTVFYALGYNYFTQRVGKTLHRKEQRFKQQQDLFFDNANHIYMHREAIALKKGESFEHVSLNEALGAMNILQHTLTIARASLFFLYNLHQQFSYIFALVLAIPNVIANKISYSNLFTLPNHFQNSMALFTWRSNHFDTITSCEVSLDRYFDLDTALNNWESLHQKTSLKLSNRRSKTIDIQNLTTKSHTGKTILKQFDAHFKKGKITLLEGPSGSGKTTILRAMAGLSPFSKGKISGLSEKSHFIPAQPYFPYNKTLLQSILYPRQQPATRAELVFIKQLMLELGLKRDIINELEHVKDWNSQLSDGEKQRIMIICAIFKKPEILLMDEATARVDHQRSVNNKEKIERALKKYLPKATIIYTDHNPSNETFYDYKISIAGHKNK